MPSRTLLAAALALGLFAPLARAAAPSVTGLFPIGVERGSTTKVLAIGSFDPWPVKVWTDRPGVDFRPGAKAGEFIVHCPESAEPGVVLLRFYNDTGASSLRPFVIGRLAERPEVEPNDRPGKPDPIASAAKGLVINGRLEKRNDVDGFRVHLDRGQTLVAAVAAADLGVPIDPILQIATPTGLVLDQVDDDPRLDPTLAFSAPSDGDYIVRLFAFPTTPDSTIGFTGAPAHAYRLTLTTGPYLDHADPPVVGAEARAEFAPRGWNLPDPAPSLLVRNQDDDRIASHPAFANEVGLDVSPHPVRPESDATTDTLAPPFTITGHLDSPGERDTFSFRAAKGKALSIRVEGRDLGSPIDPVVRILDEAGKPLAEADDAQQPGGRRGRRRTTEEGSTDARVDWTPPADALYRVEVSDLAGQYGPRIYYALSIAEPQPDFDLRLEADSYTLESGKPLTIPVRIVRRDGFNKRIPISIDGLPDGVTAKPVPSEPEGDSSRSINLVIESTRTEPFSGEIRIRGQAEGSDDARFATPSNLPASAPQPRAVWITVVPAASKPAS